MEADGRIEEALAAYGEAQRLLPGLAGPWTRRVVLGLRRRFGPPSCRPSSPGKPRIAMTSLGRNGRFGNQLLQYAHLRACAAVHGLEAQVPDWVGRDIFGLDDPLPDPGRPLPLLSEDHIGAGRLLSPPRPSGDGGPALRDVDLFGYFCGPTAPLAPFRPAMRQWFRPVPAVAAQLDAALAPFVGHGGTLVALHLRRGDFGGENWIAPTEWYLGWLNAVWGAFPDPLLYLATDDPSLVDAFAAYRPLHAGHPSIAAGRAMPAAEFLVDFAALVAAEVLAVSNSSFSFVASMLNRRCRAPFRPDRRRLIPYDPWDAPVLLP